VASVKKNPFQHIDLRVNDLEHEDPFGNCLEVCYRED
jgi:hypothetical protein